MQNEIVKQDFNKIISIINIHRQRALQEVNNNSLLIAWNVGGYISAKIKSSEWGSKVVTELSEYLRQQDPSLKGYSRRNLYMMVKFFETYSDSSFLKLINSLKMENIKVLPVNETFPEIVQFEVAQMPKVLFGINWTCHQVILNSCKTYEQRLFYILYSNHEKFEVKELQRAIKTNSYEPILGSKP